MVFIRYFLSEKENHRENQVECDGSNAGRCEFVGLFYLLCSAVSAVIISIILVAIYGTIWIVILCNIVHFYSVSFLTMTSGLKKLDSEFEAASESMNVPWYRTLLRVTVPLSLPTILEVFLYYFINSMVTVSAIIFLYAPDLKPAAVAIVNKEDSGDIAQAAAMSTLIIVANLLVRTAIMWMSGKIQKRTDALLVRTKE